MNKALAVVLRLVGGFAAAYIVGPVFGVNGSPAGYVAVVFAACAGVALVLDRFDHYLIDWLSKRFRPGPEHLPPSPGGH